MRIYRLAVDVEKYAWLVPESKATIGFLVDFKPGTIVNPGEWSSFRARVTEEDTEERRIIGDCAQLISWAPAISEHAKACLEPVVGSKCQFLPFVSPVGTMYLMNVTNMIDALDPANSRIRKFKEHVVQIYTHAFIEERIPADETVFRIPQLTQGVYATDRLVSRIDECCLVGFRAEIVWQSGSRM